MRLALGTAQFGLPYGIANSTGQIIRSDAVEILHLASGMGMDTLDTAIAYGESEKMLGEVGVRGWRVVSKLPGIPGECSDYAGWVRESLEGSLRRLDLSSLYGVLFHKPVELLQAGGDRLFHKLQQLKRDGVIQKIGVSIYDPAELDLLVKRFQFDLVQAPFSILDRRLIETGWLPRFAEQGIELHVRSVFLQGLLLMRPTERPDKFSRWNQLWFEWGDWLRANNLTPLQACLRYALSFPEINRVVVGVDSSGHLRELASAAAGGIPEISDKFLIRDRELLNPANWGALA